MSSVLGAAQHISFQAEEIREKKSYCHEAIDDRGEKDQRGVRGQMGVCYQKNNGKYLGNNREDNELMVAG